MSAIRGSSSFILCVTALHQRGLDSHGHGHAVASRQLHCGCARTNLLFIVKLQLPALP